MWFLFCKASGNKNVNQYRDITTQGNISQWKKLGSMFSSSMFNWEWSHRHVDGQTPLAASLRWKVELEGGGGGHSFIRVRRWSRSFAWSRAGRWGFPLALLKDHLPLLLRDSRQGDWGFRHYPNHGRPSPSLQRQRTRMWTYGLGVYWVNTKDMKQKLESTSRKAGM